MHLIFSILIFIFGASIGSFLSVVIHRIHKKEKGIILGTSKCPKCKKKLRALDMIPIVSYLILKGKCHFCKKPIASEYLYLEIFSGLTFVATYYHTLENLLPNLLVYLLYAIFFIGIFFYDLKHSEIPDIFLFPFIIISFTGSIIMGNSLISMIIGLGVALLFFGGQIVISKGKWLGEGDLYLGLSMANIFGWQLLLLSIVISYTLGALWSIYLLASKQVTSKTQIPFAPFLVLGSFITIFFGQEMLGWYLQTLII